METFIPLISKDEMKHEDGSHKRSYRPYKNQRDNISKQGRIVIRNLSYKVEEEDITKLFKQYGEIVEINFLTFDDGRKKGVAFLQYNNLLSALKAIEECNMKNILGRPIAVDLAVSKDRFQSTNLNLENKQDSSIKVKSEDGSQDGASFISCNEIKKEKDDTDNIKTEAMKSESAEDDDDIKEEDSEIEEEDDDSDIEEEDDDSDMEEDDDDDSKDFDHKSGTPVKEEKSDSCFRHNAKSKDVLEGRSLFIRNLSFDASEEDVGELLSQFGKLKSVLFCRDKTTQRFRGTAFAQFLDKNSSDKCLDAANDPAFRNTFRLGGRFFNVTLAVGRDDLPKKDETKKEPQDKRNLHLAREGVIREGTQSATGVSKADLAQRVMREKIKRKMLANFNIFMSPTRLYICNLPVDLGDKELRDLFKKYSPDNAVIKECRIMKNLFQCDRQGNPVSKGHGFVAFTEHNHALETLRNINNNPDIFSRDKRPIVEFSMENKAALKAKEMRIQKSKDGNKRKREKTLNNLTVAEKSSKLDKPYMGTNYDPKKKGVKAFHTHIGPKVRHKGSQKQSGKITRNQVNNQLRNSSRSKRIKKNKKLENKSKQNKKNKNSKNLKKNSTVKSKTKKNFI